MKMLNIKAIHFAKCTAIKSSISRNGWQFQSISRNGWKAIHFTKWMVKPSISQNRWFQVWGVTYIYTHGQKPLPVLDMSIKIFEYIISVPDDWLLSLNTIIRRCVSFLKIIEFWGYQYTLGSSVKFDFLGGYVDHVSNFV